MRKKRWAVSLAAIAMLLAFINTVIAQECVDLVTLQPIPGCVEKKDYSKGDLTTEDYKQKDAYPQILSNPSSDYSQVDWNIAKQSEVPITRIKYIPPAKVNVREVKDQSKLIIDQLVENGNLNNIDDLNKLNPAVRLEAAKRITSIPDFFFDTGGKATQGTFAKNEFSFFNVESLKVGSTTIAGGQGVVFKNGELTANYAGSFITETTVAANVQHIAIKPLKRTLDLHPQVELRVESVEELRIGCDFGDITIKNLTRAKVINGDYLIMALEENVTADIEDCGKSRSRLKALESNATLGISKDIDTPKYVAAHVVLDFSVDLSFGFAHENITALDETIIFTNWSLGPFAIQGMQYEYIYSDTSAKAPWKFLGLGSIFFVQLRKNETQPNESTCLNCIFFDLVEHKIIAKGPVQILRQPIKNNKIQSQSFTIVLEQTNPQAHTILLLDQNNDHIIHSFVATDAPDITLYPSTSLGIKEKPYESQMTRFFKLQNAKEPSDSIVSKYRTAYTTNEVTITDNTLVQEDKNCTLIIHPQEKATEFLTAIKGLRS